MITVLEKRLEKKRAGDARPQRIRLAEKTSSRGPAVGQPDDYGSVSVTPAGLSVMQTGNDDK